MEVAYMAEEICFQILSRNSLKRTAERTGSSEQPLVVI